MSDKHTLSQFVEISLEHYVPDDLRLELSDNVVISQAGADLVLLSFMQTEFPLISKPDEWREVKSVRSRCIFRASLTKAKFLELAQAVGKVASAITSDEEG